MAKQKDALVKIVALKRQSAEQRVRALQIDIGRMELAIDQFRTAFQAMDEAVGGFEALRLAEENGHVRKLIVDLQSANKALAAKQAELHVAREALKHALYSEDRLGQIDVAG